MSENLTKKIKEKPTHVVFYSYPKLIFVWPMIVMGFLFWSVTGWGGSGWQEFIAWTYISISVLVLMTLGIDLERNYSIFWVAVISAIVLLCMYLADVMGLKLFSYIYRWFADLNLRYADFEMPDPNDADKIIRFNGLRTYGLLLSIFLTIPYAVMMVWARLQHKWRITHNEFEHYAFGRSDDSLARGAKRVRSTYPDLLELMLCGAGTLIIYSATGNKELRRIKHVPLLYLLRKKINRLLETTAVTQTMENQQHILEEEAESETETEGDGAMTDESGAEIGLSQEGSLGQGSEGQAGNEPL